MSRGITSVTSSAIRDFNFSNDDCCSFPQDHSEFPVKELRGQAILLKSQMNHQKKLQKPRNDCTSRFFCGVGQFLTASTFFGSICTVPFPTIIPR